MGNFVIYRDGEELEVGWFGAMLDMIRSFWDTCKQTDWKHYFQGNGPGEVTWEKFTGFRESQCSLDSCAQWLIHVTGGIRPKIGNDYYIAITARGMTSVEATASETIKAKVEHARNMLMLYVDPNCTCRIGFHRRCPHHCKIEG